MKRTPIQRKSRLSRSGSLRPRSAKRQKWQREERAPFVAQQLEENPWCQMRIEGVCTGRATVVDEIRLRSAGGSATTEDNTQVGCDACHSWKHFNPNAAEAAGFYRRGYGGAA